MDDERPWRSALLLNDAPSASTRGETERASEATDAGSRLEAARIAELDLHANLAVLSACESASGRIVSGEGVLGISAGFLSAGVPSVVATLWPVQDRVAAQFVESFYDALEQGRTAASALKAAQERLRESPDTGAPFHWAGFVLLGEGDSRVQLTRRHAPPEGTRWILGAGSLVVLGAALAFAARGRAGGNRGKPM
jgi:CHAT domain-containing protein